MGLNEFAGYLAVAVVVFATGIVASEFGLRPYAFYIGIALSFAGLLSSWILVKDTKHHVAKEAASDNIPKLKNVFWDTTLFNRNLGSVTQAGLIDNLNNGMAWGLFHNSFSRKELWYSEIAIITAVYPAVWGIVLLCRTVHSIAFVVPQGRSPCSSNAG